MIKYTLKSQRVFTHAIVPASSLYVPRRYTSIIADKKDNSNLLHPESDITDSQYRGLSKTILTPPTFPHPIYLQEQMAKIQVEHRTPKNFRDKIAFWTMRNCRVCFDFVTGYRAPLNDYQRDHPGRYKMTPEKWLTRFIFLESIAGVPGSVAGFLRHLHSIRLMRRDKAWIQTLLDEAYNERMHLLTFMMIGKPTWFERILIYIAQGIMVNGFFFSYLLSPKTCHRFVGYLEEEAVRTYTHCLEEIDQGKLPSFSNYVIPDIAVNYWHMSENPNMRELINYIRADEAKHREVNHTFANLKQDGTDRNPFALTIELKNKPQPYDDLRNHKGIGWERDDLIL